MSISVQSVQSKNRGFKAVNFLSLTFSRVQDSPGTGPMIPVLLFLIRTFPSEPPTRTTEVKMDPDVISGVRFGTVALRMNGSGFDANYQTLNIKTLTFLNCLNMLCSKAPDWLKAGYVGLFMEKMLFNGKNELVWCNIERPSIRRRMKIASQRRTTLT